MLPKKNRLTQKKLSDKLKFEGKRVSSRYFTFIYLIASEINETKIGITVSTQISKKAFRRNKVKRLLREAVRPFILKFKKPVLGIFLPKGVILKSNLEEINKELSTLFEKEKIIR